MDQSLDEIIQSKRKTNFSRSKPNNISPIKRGRITKRNSGPVVFSRPTTNDQWKHDMFRGNRSSSTLVKSGHKIQISNLDFGVNDEDINELFKEFGSISRAGVNYDRSGRSLGSAEVVYVNKSSAIQARNKYNGIPLDNKPMKISIVESGSNGNGANSTFNRVGNIPRSNAGQQQSQQRPFNSNNNNNNNNSNNSFRSRSIPPMRRNGARTSGTNTGRSQKVVKTKEQLDAEMDEYLSKVASWVVRLWRRKSDCNVTVRLWHPLSECWVNQ